MVASYKVDAMVGVETLTLVTMQMKHSMTIMMSVKNTKIRMKNNTQSGDCRETGVNAAIRSQALIRKKIFYSLNHNALEKSEAKEECYGL